MAYLYAVASVSLIISAFKDVSKTKKALKAALKIFINMLPLLWITLALVSIVLYFLPDYVIAEYLGTTDIFKGVTLASLLGSISLLPGFISFPLCGLLLKKGVSYTVLAAFTTSLMMVGILT